ncbi:MAG: class A beta-lactamase-related serine hydrolase, partial [Alphaproteobacteria bacterium]|nr:class A beta-lactamase-related serine hydrolase [Candidatus Fonsibacter sp. PEL55]
MISGYCEEKYISVKKIFEDYFLKQEEIGASFAIYKQGKPLIDLWNGLKNKNNENWEENTIVNVFSATKGIYEIIVSILIDQNILDLEKPVSYYWDAFKQSNKREIKLKHILSHQSGLYRFKKKIIQADLLDWNKIINILENQEPDYPSGKKTYYHAKTHGFLVGEIIKKTTKKSLGELVSELLSKKLGVNFFIGTPKNQLSNIAILYEDKTETKISSEFNAFNNPKHEINFYNKENWQTAEVPSMNGHGNARSIAKIYDIFVNDLILEKNTLLSKSSIKKCLNESISRIDESLMMPIRWSQIGLILRGGWLFGKNKESFGHNGWGGSLGFADPILGVGIAYTTNKINPTMSSDFRIINLLKEFYKLN